MSEAQPVGLPEASPPRWSRFRRFFPLGVIAFEAIALLVVQYLENTERMPPANAFLAKFSAVGLGTILLFLWFVFLSPASVSLRKRTGLAALALLILAVATVRVEGVDGDVHFKFNWRWAPRADEALPTAQSEIASESNVDLTQTSADDSPQFLGRDRLARIDHVALDSDWAATAPKLLWRHPIGAGWSSFAVVGHYGVTQEQRGDEELVTCYDLNDGKLQWAHATPVRFHELVAGVGPRSTPTIDEGRVYVQGALGHLLCLDGRNGKLLWQHNVVTDSGATPPVWGKSCSPLVEGNLVITSAGGPRGKSLVAFDKVTGDPAWSAGDDASSYSSPTVMTLCGQRQIVMINERLTSGHDPATGKILWQRAWPDEDGQASPNVAQPLAVGDDRILLTKGYGVGSSLWQLKRDGDQWSVDVLWKNNNLKTKMTSAVIHDGAAYGLDEGTLTCIDVTTGKKNWKRTRFGHGQVLLVGDLLLVQSETGEVALVKASPKGYQELARLRVVEGQSWNYPVLSGNRLLVRTEVEVACYELPVLSPPEATP